MHTKRSRRCGVGVTWLSSIGSFEHRQVGAEVEAVVLDGTTQSDSHLPPQNRLEVDCTVSSVVFTETSSRTVSKFPGHGPPVEFRACADATCIDAVMWRRQPSKHGHPDKSIHALKNDPDSALSRSSGDHWTIKAPFGRTSKPQRDAPSFEKVLRRHR